MARKKERKKERIEREKERKKERKKGTRKKERKRERKKKERKKEGKKERKEGSKKERKKERKEQERKKERKKRKKEASYKSLPYLSMRDQRPLGTCGGSKCVAVDWDNATLHLKYQPVQERVSTIILSGRVYLCASLQPVDDQSMEEIKQVDGNSNN